MPLLLAVLVLSLSQDPDALVREGRALLQQERFEEAERTFTALTRVEPTSSRAFYYLGVARLRRGEIDAAVNALERADALSGSGSSHPNPAVLYELGTAYVQAKRFADAIRILEAAVQAVPGEASFRLQLGWAFYQLVEAEKAEAQFRAVLAREPTNVTARFYLGLSMAALGRLADAETAFREAIARDPSLVDARLGLGRVLSQAGQDEEARSELERVALEATAHRAAAADNELGLIALRSGDTAEATRRFEAAVAADPDHRQATYNLWLLYRRAGQTAKAEAMRERFQALDEQRETRSASRTASKPRDR